MTNKELAEHFDASLEKDNPETHLDIDSLDIDSISVTVRELEDLWITDSSRAGKTWVLTLDELIDAVWDSEHESSENIKQYIEIGEVSEINGRKVVCCEDIEDYHGCCTCALSPDMGECDLVFCFYSARKDGKNVYYERKE